MIHGRDTHATPSNPNGMSIALNLNVWHGRPARVAREKGGHDMCKAITILIAVVCLLGASGWYSKLPAATGPQAQVGEPAPGDQSAIHLAIATVDPLLAPTDHYRVGEQVIVTIGMTNTSQQASFVCLSSDLYQDLPILKKNGNLLPYTKWQTDILSNLKRDETCRRDDLPERILLKTNEPTVVDFLTIVDDSQLPTGAQSWYEPLTPGTYELTIQRRLGCCDGPMLESNKISFEVAP
ncbi:MAG TPA: hypothetical protein VGN86_16350 [Pyrinomonadaceae bacterium]|nr:hypothetical protein [Pyrinomonadaceae bacterium]